jgi:hypothetical protein
MSGMRVKLTFTFTAMGNCFPLVVTVTGLTNKKCLKRILFTSRFQDFASEEEV